MKTFALFFVVLFAIHSTTQSAAVKDDSIKELIVKYLNEYLATGKEYLDSVDSILNEFEANEEKFTETAVATISLFGASLNADLLQFIDAALRPNADDAGKKLLDCSLAQEDKTDDAFKETVQDTAECLTVEYKSILEVLRLVLQDRFQLEEDLQTEVDSLDACTESDGDCLLTFSQNLLEIGKKIPAEVEKEAAAVSALVKEVHEQLVSCKILEKIQSNVETIFKDTVECINA